MKLFEATKVTVRVSIKKVGNKTIFIPLAEATLDEAVLAFSRWMNAIRVSPVMEGNRTTVEFREVNKGKNGKIVSLALFNVRPDQVAKLINYELKSE